MIESVIMTSPSNDDYIAASEYFSYIENRIYNEQRLAKTLSNMGVISESSVYYITEAKVGDKVMSRWNRFVDFIKGLIAKFTESMTNILYSQKEYLEKNKDIILNRKPKNIEFSYEGDYAEGIKRMTDVKLPVFNYNNYHNALLADGNKELVNQLMNGKNGWHYDDAREDDLSGQFKDYYLAKDKGTKSGTLADLNFNDMYNFCHDTNKVKNIIKTDQNNLTQSTAQIQQAITKQLGAPSNNTNQNNTNNNNNTEENKEESAILYETKRSNLPDSAFGIPEDRKFPLDTEQHVKSAIKLFGHAEESKKKSLAKKISRAAHKYGIEIPESTQVYKYLHEEAIYEADNDDKLTAGSSGLKIKDVAGSYNKNAGDNKENDVRASAAEVNQEGKNANDIEAMANKWIKVCQPMIAAKLTACQEISKCYMQLIRAHVRSYGGKDNNADNAVVKNGNNNNNGNNKNKK